MKQVVLGALAIILVTGSVVAGRGSPCVALADAGAHWAQVYMEALKAREYLVGMPGPLEMESPMSRGAFVHVLVAAAGLRESLAEVGGLISPFVDVEPGYWAAPAIGLAYERGWTKGYGWGMFGPDASLTRAEAAVMLHRVFQPGVGEAPEVDGGSEAEAAPEWAGEGVAAAVASGWLVGDVGGGLRLQSPVKVGEACALIWRASAILGAQYDVTGTVTAVAPEAGAITAGAAGGEMEISLGPDSIVFRNGVRCGLADIKPGDEVFVIRDKQGRPAFVEARYIDDVGFVEQVDLSRGQVSYVSRSGAVRRVTVDARTDVRVLGNKSVLSAVLKGDRVYVVFDSVRGCARVLDVASMNVSGRIVSVSADSSTVSARIANGGTRTLKVDEDTVVYVDSALSSLEAVREKDVFQGSLGDDGALLFLQVFTVGNR